MDIDMDIDYIRYWLIVISVGGPPLPQTFEGVCLGL